MLIAMCGLDGAGKTTQLRRLKARLEQEHEVHATRQPTDWFRQDPLVRGFRSQELQPSRQVCVELALFSATDRVRHLRTVLEPRLAAGQIVITDRHVLSLYASLMAVGFGEIEWMMELHRFVPLPDLTFLFDVEPAVAQARVLSRADGRKNSQDLDPTFLAAMRRVFIEQPWGEDYLPEYRIIDGAQPADGIEGEVTESVLAALSARR